MIRKVTFQRKLILLLLLSSTLSSQTITRSQVIMGTFCTISLEGKNRKSIQEGFKLLKEIEKALSSYDKNAKVYQLNHQQTVMTNEYLTEVLEQSRHMYQQSRGYFDITIGSVTKALYHFGEEEKIPTKQELSSAKINFKGIIESNATIVLQKGITVDFGGIGKGYGVDKVAQHFSEQNITQGRVGLSGDIRCLNVCQFQIESPFEQDKTLMTLEAKIDNLSISTSGTYRRYIQEKSHHHLINPKTKKQGRAFISVTILTRGDNSKADAIATAVSVMPKSEALLFLEEQGVGYVLVERDGNIFYGHLEKFIKLPINQKHPPIIKTVEPSFNIEKINPASPIKKPLKLETTIIMKRA